jgi:hypothetical protein
VPGRRLEFITSTPPPLWGKTAFYGMPWGATVHVRVVDADGNTVTSASDAIVLSLAKNPDGAYLTGRRAIAVNGVATFPDLTLWMHQPDLTYALRAGGEGLSTLPFAQGEDFCGYPIGTFNVIPTDFVNHRVRGPRYVVLLLRARGSATAQLSGGRL